MNERLYTYHSPTPWLFKGEPGGTDPERTGEPEHFPEDETGHGGRKLVCKLCRTVITRRDLGMEVDGSHTHVFFNPHGYVFELGCFASAKNIVPSGPKTDEFTWFPGYTWQAVGCSGCQSLLGWRYTGRSGGFYGLILSALTEEEGRKA